MSQYDDLTSYIVDVAKQAGVLSLRNWGKSADTVTQKDDGSPVTDSDKAAELVIMNRLAEQFGDIPIVGEEGFSAGNMPDISSGRFWLVDPIDGTKDYIAGGREFTVNIGLIENWVPVAGVVHAPALEQCYFGAVGLGAFRQDGDHRAKEIRVSGRYADGLRVVASRHHANQAEMEKLLAGLSVDEWVNISSSLKFCLLADDKADLYPRFGPTHEWDTAAGDAIVRAAGGSVVTLEGETLQYGKLPRLLNEGFFARAYK